MQPSAVPSLGEIRAFIDQKYKTQSGPLTKEDKDEFHEDFYRPIMMFMQIVDQQIAVVQQ